MRNVSQELLQTTLEDFQEEVSIHNPVLVRGEGTYSVLGVSDSLMERMQASEAFNSLVRSSALGLLPGVDNDLLGSIQEQCDSRPTLEVGSQADIPSRDTGLLDMFVDVFLQADYEHGWVFGTAQDILGFDLSARRKLGTFRGYRFLDPYVLRDLRRIIAAYESHAIGYEYGPTSPRRQRFERKQYLKSLLPRSHKGLVRKARRCRGGAWVDHTLREEAFSSFRERFGRGPSQAEKLKLARENPQAYKSGVERFMTLLTQGEMSVLVEVFGSAEDFHKLANNLDKVVIKKE